MNISIILYLGAFILQYRLLNISLVLLVFVLLYYLLKIDGVLQFLDLILELFVCFVRHLG